MSDTEEDLRDGVAGMDVRLRGGGKRGNGKHTKGAGIRVAPAGGRGLEKKPVEKTDSRKGKDTRRGPEHKHSNAGRTGEERGGQSRPVHSGLKKVDAKVIGSKSRVCIPAAALELMRGRESDGEDADETEVQDGPPESMQQDKDGGSFDADNAARSREEADARSVGAASGVMDTAPQRQGDAIRESAHNPNTDVTRRTYGAMLHRILEEADVLLEVLDCRDPLGCRTWQVEHFVNTRRPELKVVLVLNKIDLVPRDVVARWVKFLRAHHQVAVFKAATSYSHRGNTALQSAVPVQEASGGQLQAGESFGAPELVQALKGIGKGQLGFGGKGKLTVGVVGYPNVGKSSLINSLLRSKAAQTGDRAGVTKHTQTLRLDKGITVIDCPGVVLDDAADEARQLLSNCLPADKARDVVSPIALVVDRCGAGALAAFYGIPPFRAHTELLCALAQKRGKLRRGGEPDQEAAARAVLQDWNRGKLKYYTLPPEEENFASVLESTVVPHLGADFSLFADPAARGPQPTTGDDAGALVPDAMTDAAVADSRDARTGSGLGSYAHDDDAQPT